MVKGTCSVDGCSGPPYRRGLCGPCYRRVLRSGGFPQKTIEDRFWEKVDQRGDGCREWMAHRTARGYGVFVETVNGTTFHRAAHRVAWRLVYGTIPEGLIVCHSCDNPPCCHLIDIPVSERVIDPVHGVWTNHDGRAGHLWLGTDADNSADRDRKGRNGSRNKTHCPQGHPYTEANTKWQTGRNGQRWRICRLCNNETQRLNQAKRRAAARALGLPYW